MQHSTENRPALSINASYLAYLRCRNFLKGFPCVERQVPSLTFSNERQLFFTFFNRSKMIRNTQMLTILVLTGLIWLSCQKNDELIDRQVNQTELTKDQVVTPDGYLKGTILASITNCNVDPVLVSGDNRGGNVECSEVGNYAFSSGRINYNCDDDGCGFDGDWPAGFTVNTNGKTVSWSYEDPNGYWCLDGIAVIVKGGPNANVYTYETGCSGGSGLTAPINPANNKPYGLSNLTFCYNLIPCGDQDCESETAFGGNSPGSGAAWWYYFDTQGPATQAIYAGQNLTDGTVTWDGTNLIINLGSWSLDPDPNKDGEQVKVQGYDVLPTNRPNAGNFDYKGSDLTIPGDGSRYYVIHLDLVLCE
jgi:hypothetical protein